MWGFAEVGAQRGRRGVEPGTRVYGYLPPSSHLVVTPADANQHGSRHTAPGAAAVGLPPVSGEGDRPLLPPGHREMQMLLARPSTPRSDRPTRLDDEGPTSRGPVLISGASSKTAIAAASCWRGAMGWSSSPSPPAQRRVSSRAWGSTAAPSPTTRSTRSSAGGHLRFDIRDGEGGRAVHFALRRSARLQHGGGSYAWRTLGGAAGQASRSDADPVLRPDRVVKRSKDGAGPGFERRVAMPGYAQLTSTLRGCGVLAIGARFGDAASRHVKKGAS